MKKSFLLPLFAVIALSSTARDFEFEGISYTVLDETAKTVMTKAATKDGTTIVAGNNVSGDITIPATVSDGENTFTVTTIGKQSFYKATGLTSIVLPGTVTSIKGDAFKGCKKMESVTFGEDLEEIGSAAFSGCESLTDVVIPDKVTYIDEETFNECYSLETVTIGKGVTAIGYYAFMYCEGLTEINIPDNVTELEEGAFLGCSEISEVKIGADLKKIGKEAFAECSSITAFNVAETNPNFAAADGVLFSKDIKTLFLCPQAKKGEYTVPSTVTTIQQYAFSECKKLTSVSMSDAVTEIGQYAFYKCAALTAAKLSNSLTVLEKYIFNGCKALTKVEVPEGVTIINQSAFQDCAALASVSLPNSLTEISMAVFRNCAKLTEITLPKNLVTISNNAFKDCTGLKTLSIPAGVKEIKDTAWTGCINLEEIYYAATTPVSGPTTIFSNSIYSKTKLFVPTGCVDAYKAVTPWSSFENIAEHTFSGIADIEFETTDAPTEVYNFSGIKVADSTENLPAGTYIVRQGNKAKKIAIK